MRKKFREYAFLTTDSFRISVNARNSLDGYRKAKKDAKKFGKKITTSYTTYGKNGIDTGWRSMHYLLKR